MKRLLIVGFCTCVLMLHSVAQTARVNLTDIKYTVQEAPEWSALFKRNTGWFGGDGIYTIPLNGIENKRTGPGSKTLFIFSDSMIGEIRDSTLMPGYKMIHNSVAVLHGNQPVKKHMKFYWSRTANDDPESVFIPRTANTGPTDYYWLGDGFVNEANKCTYIFGYRVRQVSTDAFGFREVGNTLIKISATQKAPFKKYTQRDTPFYLTDGKSDIGSYGAGIYVNTKAAGARRPDSYIYVYGVAGMAKNMTVARVRPKDLEKFNNWRFWDGNGWVTDMNKAAPVTDGVSNELSVSELPDGRYALIFQEGGMGTMVGMRLGATPYGPFGPVIKLWDCKPDLKEKTFVVYNAKAHPTLSKPGELLISYNINSVDFIKDLNKHPHLYRPRFICVKFE